MPKTAILELDSAIVELSYHVTEGLPNHVWEADKKVRLLKAVDHIFLLTLDECLIWVEPSFIQSRQITLAKDVIDILGLRVRSDQTEQFIGYMEDVIDEYVHRSLYSQLSVIVGHKSAHAWHVLSHGTARVLSPGGIMIDLDRLKDQSGIVEIKLADHWRAPPKTKESPVVQRAVDDVSKAILKDIESPHSHG